MAAKAKTRLYDLRITRVDLVDAGDNPGAHVTLFKRRHGGNGGAMTAGMEIQTQVHELMESEGITRMAAYRRVTGEQPELYKRHARERAEAPTPRAQRVVKDRIQHTTAYDTAVAKAKALVEEGKAPTFAGALSTVWKRNPDLYRQHVAERAR
jgi:hypothetical protein